MPWSMASGSRGFSIEPMCRKMAFITGLSLATILNSSFAVRAISSFTRLMASSARPGSSTMIWSSFWMTVGSATPSSSTRSRTVLTACDSARRRMSSANRDAMRTHTATPSSAAQARLDTVPLYSELTSCSTSAFLAASASLIVSAPGATDGVDTVAVMPFSSSLVSMSRLISTALSSTALSRSIE